MRKILAGWVVKWKIKYMEIDGHGYNQVLGILSTTVTGKLCIMT